MEIKRITFDELEKYNQIEMLKVFNHTREYFNLNEYTFKSTKETVIDFAKEESMDLWRKIMNHESCGIFVASIGEEWVGGCLVVTHSPDVNMLKGDMSNSVLWDIRVDSKYQGKGVGAELFKKAVNFAKSMNTKRMLIETQNNNPKAIRFYEYQGAKLSKINRNHYPDYPLEDQLIFILEF